MIRTPVSVGGAIAALVVAAVSIGGCAPQDPAEVTDPPTSLRTAASTPTPTPTGGCAEQIVAGLTPEERAGQLIVVALGANENNTLLDPMITEYHLGGVLLLAGWGDGMSVVQEATTHLQSIAGESTGGLGLLIAADQEGGQIQQLRGPGFTQIPSGVEQGVLEAATLQSDAQAWGAELTEAGVNLNLAPVADTVPESLGAENRPIGGMDRQFSGDPAVAAPHVAAFVAGMSAAGVGTTIKHFPGLGRVTGNTDATAATDTVTTADDPGLEPFVAGIAAGAPVVMTSSAFYTQIDPDREAVFSETIITDLLRGQLGYDRVVMSDDIGVAAAVSSTPVEQRATSFIAAGGDIALTADPAAVAPFHDSIIAALGDPTFAAKVDAAVTRVVDMKIGLGLASCE